MFLKTLVSNSPSMTNGLKNIVAGGVLLGAVSFGATATQAATMGIAVGGVGESLEVGATVSKPDLGGDAIEFFIPLTSAADVPTCIYGVTCGTSSDVGKGGTLISMFLRFDPVQTIVPSLLEIFFEDLDLIDANDPSNFVESIQVFDGNGLQLTDLIEDINASALVSGDSDLQTLSLDLGIIQTNPFFVELVFSSDLNSYWKGRNTAEYLRAVVTPQPVPLPASGLLLFAGVFGIGAFKRRRNAA